MQNRMELFSTAAKLFVWRLRPRAQKAQSSRSWHWVENVYNLLPSPIFGNCTRSGVSNTRKLKFQFWNFCFKCHPLRQNNAERLMDLFPWEDDLWFEETWQSWELFFKLGKTLKKTNWGEDLIEFFEISDRGAEFDLCLCGQKLLSSKDIYCIIQGTGLFSSKMVATLLCCSPGKRGRCRTGLSLHNSFPDIILHAVNTLTGEASCRRHWSQKFYWCDRNITRWLIWTNVPL